MRRFVQRPALPCPPDKTFKFPERAGGPAGGRKLAQGVSVYDRPLDGGANRTRVQRDHAIPHLLHENSVAARLESGELLCRTLHRLAEPAILFPRNPACPRTPARTLVWIARTSSPSSRRGTPPWYEFGSEAKKSTFTLLMTSGGMLVARAVGSETLSDARW